MERRELETVIDEKDGPVARIVLNRPEKANSQSSAMLADVETVPDDAEHDYDIKVVVIKANGRGFSAGHAIDPAENQDLGDTGGPRQVVEQRFAAAPAAEATRSGRVSASGDHTDEE